MFGVFGISFPSGLVVYWTTSNLWQIGQQYVMLRLGHIGPNATPPPVRTRAGWFSGLMARMEGQRPAEGRDLQAREAVRQVQIEGLGRVADRRRRVRLGGERLQEPPERPRRLGRQPEPRGDRSERFP